MGGLIVFLLGIALIFGTLFILIEDVALWLLGRDTVSHVLILWSHEYPLIPLTLGLFFGFLMGHWYG